MSRQTEQEAYAVQLAQNKYYMAESRCHTTKNLKKLLALKGWFDTKLFITWNSINPNTGKHNTSTLYGDEHNCTYKQLVSGYVDTIVLSNFKGYNGLIEYVEKEKKGQWYAAKFYFDSDNSRKFPQWCRHYEKGALVLKSVNDPVLSEDEFRTVPFTVQGEMLIIPRRNEVIATAPQPEQIDFKKHIDQQLKM